MIGDTNELRGMANYSSRGYEIFIPTGNSRADFIAVKDTSVIRVQVKTVSQRKYKDTIYELAVLTTTRNGRSTPYRPDEIDEFYITSDTKAWVIPNLEVYPSKTIMLSSNSEHYKPRHGYDVERWVL